jgi:Putative MetA-pathway of phenol degradation
MRQASLLIAASVFFWAQTTVHGQSSERNEDADPAVTRAFLQANLKTQLAGDDAYGAWRRDAMVKLAPMENFFAGYGAAYGGDAQHRKPKPQPEPEPVQRPPIDPSMVGYIDDALIHSEIRVRFDAAQHDATPDRAEYFYAKCGCYRYLPPSNPAFDPTAPGPGPGIPESVNFQQLYIFGEYAPRSLHRVSVFGQLPFRWLQPESPSGVPQAFPSSGGIGDIQFGGKFAALESESHVLTFQFASHVATGDAGKGLGTNHATIEPMVLYYQDLGGRASLEAQFGDTHPLSSSRGVPGVSGGFAGDVLTYGVGGSYQFVQGDKARVAGVLEMVGWNIKGGAVTASPANTDGANIVNLKIGPRVDFKEHHSIYFGYGIALTHTTWYHEIFRTEYRYAF